MTLQEAIAKTYLETDGKTTALAEGTSKYEVYKALLNTAKDIWFDEPDTEWNSTREYVILGVTVTASDSFALTGVDRISKREGDFIFIDHVDGGKSRYSLVSPDTLHDEDQGNVAAVQNGFLVFPTAFTASSPQFGGSIKIPQYTRPADMSAATDVVPVDNPYYIVYLAAAAKVANDVTKSYREPGFIARAGQAMQRMKQDNDAQIEQADVYSLGAATGETW